MNIQNDALEMQIAFEKNCAKSCGVSYDDLKAQLDHHESFFGTRYIETSPRHEKWLIWVEAWQQAQKVAVPDGFVLVNKNKSEAFSKKLNDYLDDAWRDGSAFDDGFVSVDEINHDKIWSLVVEAQEQSE